MKKNKKIAGDLIYSIGAIALMNMVLQFIVYPLMNRTLGTERFGDMLFWIGLVSVFAPSFGLAVNNVRLVFVQRERTQNGDYNKILLLFSIVSCFILIGIGIGQKIGVISAIMLSYIMVFSIFRNYSTVEYRLNLNYKRQFIFYSILSLGYILGGICSWKLKEWFLVFIIGETLSVLYVKYRGNIYKDFFHTSEYANEIAKRCATLSAAYLMTNTMLNLDRFVLKFCIGESAVSEYYVLSLIGKTIAIIGGPLSSVIIGYISKDKYKINRKQFQKIVDFMLVGGVVFWLAASVVTPIFIHIFYPTLTQRSVVLNLVVNAAQIIYFLTNLLLVVVLTLCSEKWQFVIQLTYTISFLILSIGLTLSFGLIGFATAALVANSIYMLFTIIIGINKSAGNKNSVDIR